MERPLPKNLEELHRTVGPDGLATMYDGHSFVLDGVEFVSGYVADSRADRFYIVKSAELLGMYRDFFAEHEPARIFELGIAEGGSVAYMALLPHVTRLVAIDNEVNRLEALDQFVEARGLGDSVSTYYGVDQADAAALGAIVDRDFGGGDIDLVVDDASHDYALTLASFDALFPRLRTGGWYLVEDWSQKVKLAFALEQNGLVDVPELRQADPLTRIGVELALAMAVAPGWIDRVSMNHEFVAVRRGPEPLDPSTFRLRDLTRTKAVSGYFSPLISTD